MEELIAVLFKGVELFKVFEVFVELIEVVELVPPVVVFGVVVFDTVVELVPVVVFVELDPVTLLDGGGAI